MTTPLEYELPIDFDNSNVDVSGVDDRRGGGGGTGIALGGGTGIVGLIIAILWMLLGGGSGSASLPITTENPATGTQATESASDLKARCNSTGALDKYTDCRIIKVYNINTEVWSEDFNERGIEFSQPSLAFFSSRTQTGCGPASADVGPFYCPADRTIYFELSFLDVLQQKFGAGGDYAQAYITAHEYGHHLQTLLGIEPQVRQLQERDSSRANQYSVAMELQADCFAGVWAKKSDEREGDGINLTQSNIDEAMNAAAAVGDDQIQAKVQGRVDPESWTHGSAAQRQQWFNTGYSTGTIDQCNTFKSYGLTR